MVDFVFFGGDLLARISNVVVMDGYCVEVQLDNGSRVILNMKSRLETVRFGMLSDQEFFKTAATDGICIRWGSKIEISLNEVFQLTLK